MADCILPTQGFSMWSLFIQADWIVKSIIIILFLASVWSWSIIFSKIINLNRLNKEAKTVSEAFADKSLEKGKMYDFGPFSQLINIATQEWQSVKVSTSYEHRKIILERMEYLFSIKIERLRDSLNSQMGILASVGSTSPFIGLFGTVWGIMSSFQCIAMSKNSSIAIVAPGIAEALFATAIGFLVAIPAVIAYNRLISSIQSYTVRVESFAQELISCCMR